MKKLQVNYELYYILKILLNWKFSGKHFLLTSFYHSFCHKRPRPGKNVSSITFSNYLLSSYYAWGSVHLTTFEKTPSPCWLAELRGYKQNFCLRKCIWCTVSRLVHAVGNQSLCPVVSRRHPGRSSPTILIITISTLLLRFIFFSNNLTLSLR